MNLLDDADNLLVEHTASLLDCDLVIFGKYRRVPRAHKSRFRCLRLISVSPTR